MKSQGRIWKFTIAVVVLAVTVYGVRRYHAQGGGTSAPQTADTGSSAQIAAMFALLENDPRVRRGQTQRAVEWVAMLARERQDAPPEAFYALGLQRYYGEKDLDAAEAALRKAISMRPGWSWPRNALGIVLFSRGDETAAMESFERAMELDPKWERPHSDLAILYRRAGKLDDAVREALTAIEMAPTSPVAHYNYAVILDVLGRAGEARKEYETVIGLDPSLPAPYYNLACGYAREERIPEAVERLARAIRLDEAFREEAEKDPDFDRIRSNPDFGRVVEGRMMVE